MSFYGFSNWGDLSIIPAAYRSTGVLNSVCTLISFLPAIFIFYCVKKRNDIALTYETSIIFAAKLQTLFMIPAAIWMTFIAIFAYEPIPMPLGLCTILKQISAQSIAASFLPIPVIAFGRYFSIVWGKKVSLLHLKGAFVGICLYPIVHFFLSIFGKPVHSAVCTMMNYSPWLVESQVYAGYLFVWIVLGVLVNIRTLFFVVAHYRRMGSISSSDSGRELSVSLGLCFQCVVPLFTMGTGIILNILWVSGVPLPKILTGDIMEVLNDVTTGLNILASIVFLRAFQDLFLDLVVPRRQTGGAKDWSIFTASTSTTIDVKPPCKE